MKYVVIALASSVCFMAGSNASAAVRTLAATMSGAQEVPAVSTGATGQCTVTLDDVTGAVNATGTFSNLTTTASNAHIHGLAPVGVSAGVIVPFTFTAATSGTFSGSGTLNPTQVAGMLNGQTYCNVHSTTFGAGEIRGQLALAAPAPALPSWAFVVMAGGLLAAGGLMIRRLKQHSSFA